MVDQALFDPAVPDGLNKLAGEIPVSGNFTYGFIWDPATTDSTAGRYRVTFKLDPTSSFGTGNPANNTFMKTATNGVRVSDTEVFIAGAKFAETLRPFAVRAADLDRVQYGSDDTKTHRKIKHILGTEF